MKITNPITIRFARKDDFLEILALYKQLWEEWDIDEKVLNEGFQKDLETSRKNYLVASINNQIVGVCSIFYKNDWHRYNLAILDELVVDKDHRSKGIGLALLSKACTVAKKQKCCSLELHSNLKRIDAHRFYETHGFEKRAFYFKKKI